MQRVAEAPHAAMVCESVSAARAFLEWPTKSEVRAFLNASCEGGGGARSMPRESRSAHAACACSSRRRRQLK
jgi:hypothetical protein